MILMPQIFDNTANENARYKRNELEFVFFSLYWSELDDFAFLLERGGGVHVTYLYLV